MLVSVHARLRIECTIPPIDEEADSVTIQIACMPEPWPPWLQWCQQLWSRCAFWRRARPSAPGEDMRLTMAPRDTPPQPRTPWTAEPRERVSVMSLPWRPLWAGEPVTAADIPVQEQVFTFDEGTIRVTCEWRAAYQHQPAFLRLIWQASLSLPTDIWARFTRPDDPTVVLTEIELGTNFAGTAACTVSDLGFDPRREPWALVLVLKEPAA